MSTTISQDQPGWPPCPTDATHFWDDRELKYMPVQEKLNWYYSMAFKRWMCLVVFLDGHKVYTSPDNRAS